MVQQPDKKAEEIIKLAAQPDMETTNFRNLYQQVADNMLPRENQITGKRPPGEAKTTQIHDPTPQFDLEDMVSGMSDAFFPPGEEAFAVSTKDKEVSELDHIKRYLHMVTQKTHNELFDSNFMLQLNETLTSLIGFGNGCLYSEFLLEPGMPLGLNFKDWDIAFYRFWLNSHRRPDSILLEYKLDARQMAQEFKDRAGEKALLAASKPETSKEKFPLLHIVRPNTDKDPLLSDSLNLPYESVFVNVREKIVVEEGGFEEFPFAIPRWQVSSNERWGRGQGTKILPAAKQLQEMHAALIECAQKHNDPPREILDNFQGKVRVKPGGANYVQTMGSIKALDNAMLGNFPITEKSIDMQQQIIHRAFFVDVFTPLANLTGDRRTTLEIMERVKQAMKKLALPVYRLQTELFTPVIIRSVLLLIENGRIPYPPKELQGRSFNIQYTGVMALALRDHQARAFQQLAGIVAELNPVFPSAKHTISMERALPDIAMSLGVKHEHLATAEELAAKKQQDQQMMQQMQAMQAAQITGKAFKDTSKAAESGSPAEQLQESLAGA